MSVADDIDALIVDAPGRCKTCQWLTAQPPEVQAAFDRYLERLDPQHPSYAPLLDVCRGNGLNASSRAFREHIRNHHTAGGN